VESELKYYNLKEYDIWKFLFTFGENRGDGETVGDDFSAGGIIKTGRRSRS